LSASWATTDVANLWKAIEHDDRSWLSIDAGGRGRRSAR
jgi:hypothetical protein